MIHKYNYYCVKFPVDEHEPLEIYKIFFWVLILGKVVRVWMLMRPAPASGPAAARRRDIFASQNHFSGDAAPGAGWAEVLHFMYTGVTPKWQSGLLGIWGMRDY